MLNGINEYPNYDWIDKLDPDHEYEEAWNRYAHIAITLDDKVDFELITADSYILHITYDKLKELDIKYFYVTGTYYNDKLEKFGLNTIYSNNDTQQYIYEIQ